MQIIKRFAAAIIAILLVAVYSPAVYSQNQQNQPSGSGLSISPTISEYTLKPGTHQSLTVTLKNITVDDVLAQAVINDFTADNSTGNPKIITDTSIKSPNSIREFVKNVDNVPLKKGQQKNVILDIAVPANAAPGAYFGVIRYKAVPTGVNAPGPGQVALTASVGTIVLITVPGNLKEQVQVQGLHVYRGARDSSFFFGPPDKIGVEIRNFGNGFIKPFGTVEVHDTFDKLLTTYQLNNPKQPGNILPSSTRIFTHDLKGASKIGRYKIIASVSWGSGSQVLTLEKSFWYIPLWLVAVILIVLAVLIFLVIRTYRRYRRNRRHAHRR